MPPFTRRTFVGWLGTAAAVIGGRRVHAATPAGAADAVVPQSAGLPTAALLALAEAVLPTELGSDGLARATREFSAWVDRYRANVELLHPYGSDRLSHTGPSPLPTWRRQLASLQEAGKARYGRPWNSLGIPERQAMVRAAIGDQARGGMPEPARASHVALALMAHYFQSPGAIDLAYEAQVGRYQCRPLVHNAREPLPLSRRKA